MGRRAVRFPKARVPTARVRVVLAPMDRVPAAADRPAVARTARARADPGRPGRGTAVRGTTPRAATEHVTRVRATTVPTLAPLPTGRGVAVRRLIAGGVARLAMIDGPGAARRRTTGLGTAITTATKAMIGRATTALPRTAPTDPTRLAGTGNPTVAPVHGPATDRAQARVPVPAADIGPARAPAEDPVDRRDAVRRGRCTRRPCHPPTSSATTRS